MRNLSMVIVGVDSSPEKAGAITNWTKAYWEALHPFNQGGGYVNFMMADEGQERVKAAYGANYERLAALKRKFRSAPYRPTGEHPAGQRR